MSAIKGDLQRNLANSLIVDMCELAGYERDYIPAELLNLPLSAEARDAFILLLHHILAKQIALRNEVTQLEYSRTDAAKEDTK